MMVVRKVFEEDAPLLHTMYIKGQPFRQALENYLSKTIGRGLEETDPPAISPSVLALWLQAIHRLRSRVSTEDLKSILARDSERNVMTQKHTLHLVYTGMFISGLYLLLSLTSWFRSIRKDTRRKHAAKLKAKDDLERLQSENQSLLQARDDQREVIAASLAAQSPQAVMMALQNMQVSVSRGDGHLRIHGPQDQAASQRQPPPQHQQRGGHPQN